MTLKEHQPALTVKEQIANLREKNLIITNEDEASQFLNDVSYFRLIKAFSLGLKPKNGNYLSDVTFEQICDLYKFNAKFRQSLFTIIEIIEVNLRCRIANYFSSKYGVLGYEAVHNFTNPLYHQEFLADIDHEIDRNKNSPFVKNFRENYVDAKIPMYALIELFSFGTLSKFYKNMKNEDKKAIAKTYNIGYTYLESWIESIAYVRNICAHYGRLYNAKLVKTPILYNDYNKLGISNNRIFGVLLCIHKLIKNDNHWSIFVEDIKNLVTKYEAVKIELMGFPDNWEELLM